MKSWSEKMKSPASPEVVTVDKPLAGIPAGARVLIATPALVKEWIEAIPLGRQRTVEEMRGELARRFSAEATCPLTTGIFLRVVAEVALEDLAAGKPFEEVTPFWRVIDADSRLAKKLPAGQEFVGARRAAEGIG